MVVRNNFAGACRKTHVCFQVWALQYPGAFNPNSEVEVECGAAARGAHAAGVRFSAARRKSRPPNFFAPKSDKECETKVWASRPNRHAGRVRYHSYFGVRVKIVLVIVLVLEPA